MGDSEKSYHAGLPVNHTSIADLTDEPVWAGFV